MKHVNKAITATVGGLTAALVVVLTPENYETFENIMASVLMLLTALGVYQVPNGPTPEERNIIRHDRP